MNWNRHIHKISACMLIGMLFCGVQSHGQELVDVSVDDWFYEDVSELIQIGIISGYADGSFQPDEEVLVDAFIKMVVSSLGYELTNGDGYWASTFVDKALELNLIHEDDYDFYNRPIQRIEMARIAAKALDLVQDIGPYAHFEYQIEDFEAIDVASQASVMIAMNEGIITGFEDYSFRPEAKASRAQAAVVISRLINADKRVYSNAFESKIEAMKEEKIALEADTRWMHSYVDRLLDIVAGENLDIKDIDDTGQVINTLNNYLDKQLALIGTVAVVEHGDALYREFNIEGIDWVLDRQLGHIRLIGNVDEASEIIIDILDDVSQIIIYNQLEGVKCEFERHNEENLYYIEFYDMKAEQKVGYEISLKAEDKYQVIKKMNGAGAISAYTIYFSGRTIFVNEERQLIYQLVNDHHYEIEKTTAYGKEVYVSLRENDYYSDYSDGALTGDGYRRTEDGIVYIGEFEDGELNGMGSMFFTNGIVIEGEFDDFIPTLRASNIVGEDRDLVSLTKEMDHIIEVSITDEMTNREKIKAIHDYLVLHITYAEDSVEDDLADMNYNNGYTAIIEGRSVCLGYAQAMNLLLNHMGIDAYIILGDSDQDGVNDHAWNYVYDRGVYKHVDVTWDDLDEDKKIAYDYFMKSDASILKHRDIYKILGWDD